MSELSVFSGECLMAICGEPSGFNDITGAPLFTGDIVIVFTDDYRPHGLTVVVSDQWTTFSDGAIESKDGHQNYFVMGIKAVPLNEDGEWKVLRVKSFADCIQDEHWPAYRFSYGKTPESALRAVKGESNER